MKTVTIHHTQIKGQRSFAFVREADKVTPIGVKEAKELAKAGKLVHTSSLSGSVSKTFSL